MSHPSGGVIQEEDDKKSGELGFKLVQTGFNWVKPYQVKLDLELIQTGLTGNKNGSIMFNLFQSNLLCIKPVLLRRVELFLKLFKIQGGANGPPPAPKK